MDLIELGWSYNNSITNKEKDLIPGRVTTKSGKHYGVITQEGELKAILPNSYLNRINDKSEIPVVGDWVGLRKNPEVKTYHIDYLYKRKNKLSRKVSGAKSEEQIIASNIDVVFIVTSVDADFNVRRLERYLAMVYEINAQPVIVLNKIDKIKDVESYRKETEGICQDIPIIAISATEGYNIDDVGKYIKSGKTVILIGSSGVGKSTLINQLLGYSRQAVGETRESDDKGRHITSTRELIILPNGGMIIDNPGIRELQLWSSGDGISELFKDIEDLSRFCKFKDCLHEKEPKCAVRKAVEEGKISTDRFMSYKKLLREQEYFQLRLNTYERRKKDKRFGKMCRKVKDIQRLKGKN